MLEEMLAFLRGQLAKEQLSSVQPEHLYTMLISLTWFPLADAANLRSVGVEPYDADFRERYAREIVQVVTTGLRHLGTGSTVTHEEGTGQSAGS